MNKKFLRRKIKNRTLLNCSPMTRVSYETNPSCPALWTAMEFGKNANPSSSTGKPKISVERLYIFR